MYKTIFAEKISFKGLLKVKKLRIDLALFRDYLGFIIFNVVHFLIEGKLNEILVFILIMLSFVACKESEFKTGRYFAGGVYAPAEKLNLGKTVYTEYCTACHGVEGDGNGVASKGLIPPPRNFKKGIYKFGKVIAGEFHTTCIWFI